MNEQTVILGDDHHLVATLTSATGGATASPGCVALLTNAGVIPRIGPHRMNVRLARRFAALGIPSIRFDMSGLGDSRRATSGLPADQQSVLDTRSAMDVAQAQFGCDRFFMVGFCSGAEVAHLVALEDRRLRAAVMWDWFSFETPQSRLRAAKFKMRRAGPTAIAKKLLTRMLGTGPGVESASPPGDVAEVAEAEVPRDLYVRRIQTLVDDGVELLFAYSGGEPERFNHQTQFREMFGAYPFVDKVAFAYLDQSDHLVTRREAQARFTVMVEQWLEQRVLTGSVR